MFDPQSDEPPSIESSQLQTQEAGEWYERGLALRKAGLFKQAIEQFEQATNDQRYSLKAYAQIGLCCKSNRQYEQAVSAFRNALQAPATSMKETVQILYVLGRTLESLDRIGEALEAYRWLRREDPQFRDVAARIEWLSTRRAQGKYSAEETGSWAKQVVQSCRELLMPQR